MGERRKYDVNGRALLKRLCVGHGADIGCNAQKITENCVGVDIDAAVFPDVAAAMDMLPFADGELDFLVSCHCLEHASDAVCVLNEWRRVLKSGGRIGIVVPHGEYCWGATLGDGNGTHRQLFTPKTLLLFLEHAGFIQLDAVVYERPYAYKQTPGIFGTGVKA